MMILNDSPLFKKFFSASSLASSSISSSPVKKKKTTKQRGSHSIPNMKKNKTKDLDLISESMLGNHDDHDDSDPAGPKGHLETGM